MDLEKLTYSINGAIFEVNHELGHGFLEKIYEKALLYELRLRGLKAESQFLFPLQIGQWEKETMSVAVSG
jgi:GxxExxY protein